MQINRCSNYPFPAPFCLSVRKGTKMKLRITHTYSDTQLRRVVSKGEILYVKPERAELLLKGGVAQKIEDKMSDVADLIETKEIEIKMPTKETKEVKKKRK